MRTLCSNFLIKLSTRIADEIQRHIVKRGKRNAISRLYHAKDDKEAIANWRSDLDGILRVFNVCSATPTRPLLTFGFQAELGINERPTVSDTDQDAASKHTTVSNVHRDSPNTEEIIPDVRRGVPDTNPIVSSVRSDVTSAPTIVSDGHNNKLKNREGVGGRNQAVSTIYPLPVIE